MTGHGLAAERLALDKQKFGFEVQQAQKKADELINAAPKLSVNMEKAIEKSAGDAAASRNAADSMTTLADTLEKEKPTLVCSVTLKICSLSLRGKITTSEICGLDSTN